jgi:site-specific DNA recombinase
VPLWVPEVGGPIEPANEAHDLVMSVFGGMSKGERNRIKIRVRTAMAAQARIEGPVPRRAAALWLPAD